MCPDCQARLKMARDNYLNGRLGKAAVHVSKGVAEMVGLKPKTGRQELAALSTSTPKLGKTEQGGTQ